MKPEEIDLSSIDKMFEYEKHARFIDNLSEGELKDFAKLYCKMYLHQQEVISMLSESSL
jgi:hypothetical protein